MRIGDAATYMGVTDRTIRQWIAEGKIPAHRMGQRVIRLRQSDLDEALKLVGK
jgi:excisionase family DNA binding protein